ncbi:MAG: hypothetical protein ACLPHI_04205 [Terriglobales bacterium]
MLHRLLFFLFVIPIVSAGLFAQGVAPYSNAITNRAFYAKTPMTPPPVNIVFQDPDLGGSMVRITDENTNPKLPGQFFLNPDSDVNEWSMDEKKFYVVGGGDAANLAFGFDPDTMTISALPGAGAGGALAIPLREGPTFSFVDPDLMYGTALKAPLTITTYRFSTGKATPLFDTTNCATQPPLVAGPKQSSSDTTLSNNDGRIQISAGGRSAGHRPFVIVYDQQLGCRWYNTQTGQVGGTWGPTGQVNIPDTFSVNHAKISGNGQYVKIGVDQFGFYVWDVTSLNVQACPFEGPGPHCSGYAATGYNSYINAPGVLDELNTFSRPLADLTDLTQLINPLPQPYYTGMEKTFGWSNGALSGNVPVCGATYSPTGNQQVRQPYDGEVFCIETDGVASTIWRFVHNRAVWNPKFYWSQPYGNISLDGRFFSFSSSWDLQLGTFWGNDPRSDVWIVKLD